MAANTTYYVFRIRRGRLWYAALSVRSAMEQAAADAGLTMEDARGGWFQYPEMVEPEEMTVLQYAPGVSFADRLEQIRSTLTGPVKFLDLE